MGTSHELLPIFLSYIFLGIKDVLNLVMGLLGAQTVANAVKGFTIISRYLFVAPEYRCQVHMWSMFCLLQMLFHSEIDECFAPAGYQLLLEH